MVGGCGISQETGIGVIRFNPQNTLEIRKYRSVEHSVNLCESIGSDQKVDVNFYI